MAINLSLIFQHPEALSNFVQYRRIDNSTNAPFITVVPNPVTSPAVIASGIPNGQYQIQATPVYADGRVCQPTDYFTPACSGLNSISARISAGNLIISYNAPSTVVKVRMTVSYPNGGSNIANYVNNGVDIIVPIPSGLTGEFLVQGQSACDETSAFYSGFSSTVSVTIGTPVAGTYGIGTNSATICSATTATYYTDGPFTPGATLYTDIALSIPVTSATFIVYNNAVYSIGSTGIIGAATGNTCNAVLTGPNSLSAGIPTAAGTIVAPAGTLVNVNITAGGPSGGTYTLNFNIPLQSIFQNVTNGIQSFTFTMPPAGNVSWNANYTSSNSSGSGSIAVS